MRIWKRVVLLAFASAGLVPAVALGQAVRGNIGRPIILTNRMLLSSNALSSQTITPNLAVSNVTPAIGRQGFTPAITPQSISPAVSQQDVRPVMPTPGVVTPGQTQNFTAVLGQPTIGVGQQGSGTAIGQQGSGTAIGQQGVGTAIIPNQNAVSPGTNAIVIGQPEPFVPAAPAVTPPTGFTPNLQNRFGQQMTPVPGAGVSNSMVVPAAPRAVLPSGRTLTPTGRR